MLVANQTHMVKFNCLTIQTSQESLLAALLCCVSFRDRDPRMHSGYRGCGISPLIFWNGQCAPGGGGPDGLAGDYVAQLASMAMFFCVTCFLVEVNAGRSVWGAFVHGKTCGVD